jgi:glycosyltransferase involved in cell wall biosynthesis
MEVSVVIPVYNAEAFLADAVSSALRCADVKEVLLVEDGSPDASLAECERLADHDPRIILLRHPGGANRGAAASRNLGVAHATRPYIAFLDADDRYLSDRFDAERRIFAELPEADGVYGAVGTNFHSEQGRQRFETHFEGATITTVTEPVPPGELLTNLVLRKRFGHIHLDALTVKRSALDSLGSLFAEDLRLHQDTEFILRMAHHARLYPGSIEVPVALRGVHDGNRVTANRDPAATGMALYGRLFKWAEETKGVPDDVRTMFRARLYLARSMKAGSIGERWRIGRELWTCRAFLSSYDKRHAFIRLLVGPDMHVHLHRILGRNKPA